MGLRKANAYSKRPAVPYTRISKKKQRSYIKVVPPQKIVKFSMGSTPLYRDGKFPYELTMTTIENCQVRHNALEACRQYLNKKLDDTLAGQYLFKVIPFPHHIQRENKMLTGAGADRMSTGMQLSFGKCIGKAAILKKGEPLFFIAVPSQKATQQVRVFLHQIKAKLPCRTRVLYNEKK